jgi:hypothetical protein
MGSMMSAIKIRAGFGKRTSDEVGNYSHLVVTIDPRTVHAGNSRSFLTMTYGTETQAFGQVLVSWQEALLRCGR